MATFLGAEGYKVLQKYEIPVAPYEKIRNMDELEKAVKKFGLPIVLKAIGPKILHKTEAKAVQICKTAEDARKAFGQLSKRGHVLAQKFISGTEVIIGAKQDATFGQVLLFGLGGIFVEVFKDVSFRVCPIQRKDAQAMIGELKAYAVLKGARGQKPINFKLMEDVLINASNLAKKEKIKEMDINPFIINDKSGFSVDIRVVK